MVRMELCACAATPIIGSHPRGMSVYISGRPVDTKMAAFLPQASPTDSWIHFLGASYALKKKYRKNIRESKKNVRLGDGLIGRWKVAAIENDAGYLQV